MATLRFTAQVPTNAPCRLAASLTPTMTNPVYGPLVTAEQFVVALSIAGIAGDMRRWYLAVEYNGTLGPVCGSARAFPDPGAPASYSFLSLGCAASYSRHPVWTHMHNLGALFAAHIGDLHYLNETNGNAVTSTDVRLRLELFNAVFARSPEQARFYANTALRRQGDDHDKSVRGGFVKGSDTLPSIAEVDRRRFPMLPSVNDGIGVPPYFWEVVGRFRHVYLDLRSWADDPKGTPTLASRSILGPDQETMLLAQIDAAGANGQGLVIHSPLRWTNVEPDGWGRYTVQRRRVADRMAAAGLQGRAFIITGDRHAQFMGTGPSGDFSTSGNMPLPMMGVAPADQHTTTAPVGAEAGHEPELGSFAIVSTEDAPVNFSGFGITEITDIGGTTASLKWTIRQVQADGSYSDFATHTFTVTGLV